MSTSPNPPDASPRRPRGRWLLALASLAVVLVGALATYQWKEIRARVVFQREFERVESPQKGFEEYRHRPSGVIFAIEREAS